VTAVEYITGKTNGGRRWLLGAAVGWIVPNGGIGHIGRFVTAVCVFGNVNARGSPERATPYLTIPCDHRTGPLLDFRDYVFFPVSITALVGKFRRC